MIQSPCGLTASMNESRICPTGFSVASADRSMPSSAASTSGPHSAFRFGNEFRPWELQAAVIAIPLISMMCDPNVCGAKRATGIAAFASTAKLSEN